MAATIKRAEYYRTTISDHPGEAYKVLAELARGEISLIAFSGVPVGPETTQITLAPEDPGALARYAVHSGLALTGPEHFFIIQGDDELGALAMIHEQLARAGVNVYASTGVTNGRGGFGYSLSVRAEDFERAAQALGI